MPKNLKQILSQIEKLQREADVLKNKERAGVIARIQEAIDHYGITTEELFSKRPRKARVTAAKKPRRSKAVKVPSKSVGEPKYHDGSGRTWTGRGKRPAWFVEALGAGKTAESMLISQSNS